MPKNLSVEDVKPKNSLVQDTKPKNTSVVGETVLYTETKTTRVGEPYGLLLLLTHSVTETFTGPRL